MNTYNTHQSIALTVHKASSAINRTDSADIAVVDRWVAIKPGYLFAWTSLTGMKSMTGHSALATIASASKSLQPSSRATR